MIKITPPLPKEWSSLNIHFMFAVSGLFSLDAADGEHDSG